MQGAVTGTLVFSGTSTRPFWRTPGGGGCVTSRVRGLSLTQAHARTRGDRGDVGTNSTTYARA
eukprot:5723475-Alexandrium_andersonii.AAC.1